MDIMTDSRNDQRPAGCNMHGGHCFGFARVDLVHGLIDSTYVGLSETVDRPHGGVAGAGECSVGRRFV